jgi:hypothetical protein
MTSVAAMRTIVWQASCLPPFPLCMPSPLGRECKDQQERDYDAANGITFAVGRHLPLPATHGQSGSKDRAALAVPPCP